MSFVGKFVETHIVKIQYVLTAVIILLAVAIFGLAVSLTINTVVTENDLLLGTVVSDADRSKIQTITGLALFIFVAASLSAFFRYRYQK